MSSLSTHGISKRYGARRVVNGVSLTLRTGEVAGLLGVAVITVDGCCLS